MERGVLYGVGVGPGDPELLTRKAQRILSQADVIAVPDKGAGEQTALKIVGELAEGKPLLRCHTPMVRDRAALDAAYGQIAAGIAALLDEGKTVAYITLGDPSIYSTYLYIHRRVLSMGCTAEIIPGVPSFCAAAARLGLGQRQAADRPRLPPGCGGLPGSGRQPGVYEGRAGAGRAAADPGRARPAPLRRHGGELRHGGGAGLPPLCRRAGG